MWNHDLVCRRSDLLFCYRIAKKVEKYQKKWDMSPTFFTLEIRYPKGYAMLYS